MTQKFRSFTILAGSAFLAALTLTGCSEYRKTNEAVRETEIRADSALSRMEPSRKLAEPLTIDRTPYYGSQAMPITNGTSLPAKFLQPGSVVLTFPGPVTMGEFAQLVQGVTGLRVISREAEAASGSSQGNSSKLFIPGDGEVVTGGRVVWQGRLPDLLNQAADVYGGDWSYDGASIKLSNEITRTFMLNALANGITSDGEVQTDTSGGSSSGGGSSSSGPTNNVKSSISIKIWDEIKEAVASIMGNGGRSAFSPSTGAITVTGTPEQVRNVETYLNQQNSMRLRRIGITVSVLSVTTSNSLDVSTDATSVLRKIFDSKGLQVSGGSTGMNLILRSNASSELSASQVASTLRATEGISRVSIEHSGSLVTLSDQPAPLQVGRQISYLARMTTTTSDTSSSASVSLEPGQVNVGLMMTALPRIVETNKVLLRLAVSISNTSQPFPTFGAGARDSEGRRENEIQLPEVSNTGFLQNAVLSSGETLVLAGFEKNTNSAKNDGIPGGGLLGATRGVDRSREITVLLLNTEIMPEDPITVINQ